MKANNKFRLAFLLFLITFLSLFLLPQGRVKASTNEDSIEIVGVLGPHHILSASDFRISLAELDQMDILALSNASVYNTLEQSTSTDGIVVLRSEIEKKPGVYAVELGFTQDDQVRSNIKVTVHNDSPSNQDKPVSTPSDSEGPNNSDSVPPTSTSNPSWDIPESSSNTVSLVSSSSPLEGLPKTAKGASSINLLPSTGERSGSYAIAGVIILLLMLLGLIILRKARMAQKKSSEQTDEK